ncbi:hypothetical protein FACS18949_15340 [Clostridia bacterium]|nr:hypothetical protein FACS18949_15340 [Clostridia bacterium]
MAAAKAEGIAEVPCVFAEHLTGAQNEFANFIFAHSDFYGEFILTGELPDWVDTWEPPRV